LKKNGRRSNRRPFLHHTRKQWDGKVFLSVFLFAMQVKKFIKYKKVNSEKIPVKLLVH